MGTLTAGSGTDYSTKDSYLTALQLGSDQSFIVDHTSDTVVNDAVNGNVPIVNTNGTGWGQFFQDTAKALVGYGLAKDAQQNGVVAHPSQTTPTTQPQPARNNTGLLIAGAAIVGLALLALHASK